MVAIGSNIESMIFKFITKYSWSDLLSKCVYFLTVIFIFFNPFPHTTSIKEICFYVSVFIVIVLLISEKKYFTFKTPLMLPFGLFILWSFLSIFFAIDKENSIHDFYSHLIRYVILYYILINFFNSEKHLDYLSRVMIISSTVFSIGSIIYFYFVLGNPLSAKFGVDSFAQTPVNIIAILTIFAIILSLNYFRNNSQLYIKIILSLSVLMLFIAILMTQQRSALLALLFAVIYFFFKNKKWMFAFVILIIIISAIFPIKSRLRSFNPKKMYIDVVQNVRIKMNYLTFEVIKEHPIIGIGYGLQTYGKLDLERYQNRLPKKYQQEKIVGSPHNIVLDVAVRLGVVGLGFFFYIIVVFFKMCREIIKYGKNIFFKNWGRCLFASFIAVFTIGLFQPVFSHMPEVVFCTIFSMTTIIWRLNTKPILKDSI